MGYYSATCSGIGGETSHYWCKTIVNLGKVNTIPCMYTLSLSLSDSEKMTGYIVSIYRKDN